MENLTSVTETQPKSFFKPSTLKKGKAIFALLAVSLFYQNFTFNDGFKMTFIPVDEGIRAKHARELLGSQYSGSAAQLVENSNSLGMAIFNEVFKNLPKAYKKEAINLSLAVLHESEKYEFDPVFVLAIVKTESSFNPKARGRHGEIGLMQIKPKTAEWIANKYGIPWRGAKSLENPKVNIRIGIAYMNYLRGRFDGHANKYLSAYNMGAARVSSMYASEKKPKEYSQRVMKNYRDTYRRLAAATTVSLIAGN